MESQARIAWTADEYKKHHHTTGWYAGLFLFGGILVAWGLYTNNIITTILFILIVFVLYFLSHRTPNKVLVALSDKGISLNDQFFPYKDIQLFWILQHEDAGPELHLETKHIINRRLTIELEDQDPQDIREFLVQHVEEIEDYEEGFIDFLLRKFRL